MLPPAEIALPASREAVRPLTWIASGVALALAAPLAAQSAADDVGTVVDPQGEPGDPQPDQPSLDPQGDVDDLLTVSDPNAGLDPPPVATGEEGIDADGNREIDFEADSDEE